MFCMGGGRGDGRVAIVTGASFGLGKGMAEVLANEEGFTVYATGRTLSRLEEMAKESQRGPGRIVACKLDQGDDAAVKKFVKMVETSQGRCDVLVNCACGTLAAISDQFGKRFWERPPEIIDSSLKIGTRSAYVMSALVAPMMVKNKKGLIVQVSSSGGFGYLFDVSYGVGKASMDRLSMDMAADLMGTGVHSITLYPGGAQTERAKFPGGETVTFSGRAVAALANASTADLDKMNGKVMQSAELADKYGFVDSTGKMPEGDYSNLAFAQMLRGAMEGGTAQYQMEGKIGGLLGSWDASNNPGMGGCLAEFQKPGMLPSGK